MLEDIDFETIIHDFESSKVRKNCFLWFFVFVSYDSLFKWLLFFFSFQVQETWLSINHWWKQMVARKKMQKILFYLCVAFAKYCCLVFLLK